MALAFVLVVVAAFLLVEWQRQQAQDNSDAKDIANQNLEDANRKLASTNEKARRFIDAMCLQLSVDGWGEDPAIQMKRKDLLEQSLAYYRDFLDNPEAETPRATN